jgi:hypothetical protein
MLITNEEYLLCQKCINQEYTAITDNERNIIIKILDEYLIQNNIDEFFLNVPIEPFDKIYKISNLGNIYSNKTKIIRKWAYDKDGYPYIKLNSPSYVKKEFIHSLVCMAFYGPRPDNYVVRHYPDFTPTNVNLKNLAWTTVTQNNRDRLLNANNTQTTSKFDELDIIEIKEMLKKGSTIKNCAELFGTTPCFINKIIDNLVWKDIGENLLNHPRFINRQANR